MLNEKKKSDGYTEYGYTCKKLKMGKVDNMLFKDVCICVNTKRKSKIEESGYLW